MAKTKHNELIELVIDWLCDELEDEYGDPQDILNALGQGIFQVIGTAAENPREMLDGFAKHLMSQPVEEFRAEVDKQLKSKWRHHS